jgi:hypothetical protein
MEVTDTYKQPSLLLYRVYYDRKSFNLEAPNIRQGWKWLTVTNSLAYYSTEFIMTKRVLECKPKHSDGWGLLCTRQVCKWLTVTNSLAYYCMEFIMNKRVLMCKPQISDNIRKGQLTVTNSLAYYYVEFIMNKKVLMCKPH